MPQARIPNTIGGMFAGMFPNPRAQADAYRVRQGMMLDQRRVELAEQNAAAERAAEQQRLAYQRQVAEAQAGKARADAALVGAETQNLEAQMGRVDPAAETLGAYFRQRYANAPAPGQVANSYLLTPDMAAAPVPQEMLQGTIGEVDARVAERRAGEADAMSEVARIVLGTTPGANPAQAAEGLRTVLGTGDLLYSDDAGSVRRGAAAATGTLPTDKTRLTPEEMSAGRLFEQGLAREGQAADYVRDMDRQRLVNEGDLAEQTLENEASIEGARLRADATVDAAGIRRPGAKGAAGETGGGYELSGTGMEQQAVNIMGSIAEAVSTGQRIVPAAATRYAQLFTSLYGLRTDTRRNPDGTTEVIEIQPPIPPGLPSIAEVRQAAGLSANEVDVTETGTVAPSVTPELPGPAAPAVSGQNLGNGVSISTVGTASPKSLTMEDSRKLIFFGQMLKSNTILDRYGNAEGTAEAELPVAPMQTGALRGQYGDAIKYLANGLSSGAAGEFAVAVEGFLNPALRLESGAAVPEAEYPRYMTRFIPEPGSKPEAIKLKAELRQLYIRALEVALERAGVQRPDDLGSNDNAQAVVRAMTQDIDDIMLSGASDAEVARHLSRSFGAGPVEPVQGAAPGEPRRRRWTAGEGLQ